MIDSSTLNLFKDRYKALTADGRGDDSSGNTRVLTLGLVVNTDDPLEMGRLQVFCPALNDNPKKIMYLPWCVYITPFGGSINSPNYTRGTGDGSPTSEGAIHYGFWGVPELGAHVLVGCIDGDIRRRFWAGCLPEHQETHTQFSGRFDWTSDNGTPDGPLTSKKKPIQPIYDNWTQAFIDRKSREWKTRGADYQTTINSKDGNGAPSESKGNDYLDESYEGMSKYEKDEWVRNIMGANGYDWSGFKNAGAFKSSKVFGFSSPGFHSLTMDDRPFNLRTRIRSATGHQIIMDDTNERIYIMTNKGNNYIEMDSNGNIDMFSENRISVASRNDINFTSNASIRLYAAESIHLYAGHDLNVGNEDEPKLEEPPIKGEIRIQAERDIHTLATNIRQRSSENTYHEAGINFHKMVGDSSYTTVQRDINQTTVTGDHITNSGNNIQATSAKDTKHYSHGTGSFGSFHDMEMQSFNGKTSLSAKMLTQIKSMSDDVHIHSGQVSGTGNVVISTPKSQSSVGESGINQTTTEKMSHTGSEIELLVTSGGMATPPTPSSLMFGTGLTNKIVIGLSNIAIHAPLGDIIHKTALTGHTYNKLASKVDELAVNLDVLTKQTSLISDAIDAAVGGFTPPVVFDLLCLDSSMFGSLPSVFLDLFPSLDLLNDALALLGYGAVTLETIGALLNGNSLLLGLLGLPTDLVFPSFGSSCTGITELFTGAITPLGTDQFTPIPLRQLINDIFTGGSVLGSPPPLTPYDDSNPCPLTISPPIGGIL